MRELKKKEIEDKVKGFYPAFEEAFGFKIEQKFLENTMDEIVSKRVKDYIEKYLGDFKDITLFRIKERVYKQGEKNAARAKSAKPKGSAGPTVSNDSTSSSVSGKQSKKVTRGKTRSKKA